MGSRSAVLRDALSLVMTRPPDARRLATLDRLGHSAVWKWVGLEVAAANDHTVLRRKLPAPLAEWIRRGWAEL